MCRGTAGSVSSLRRSSATWVSTVRLNTAALYPHTSVRSSMRVTTAPSRRSSATNRSNSFGVSGTGCPFRSTVRDAGITSTGPKCSGGRAGRAVAQRPEGEADDDAPALATAVRTGCLLAPGAAAMQRHQLPHHGETDACARHGGAAIALEAPEPIPHALPVGGRNARPLIVHRDPRPPVGDG